MSLADPFILRIRGLCGAGKTTLAKILVKELDARVFEIGSYRRRGRDEADSWDMMLAEIMSHFAAGGRCIVPTTGLNNNEFLLDEIPGTVLVWLDVDLDTLSQRIRQKPFWERGYFNFLSLRIYRGMPNKDAFNRRGYDLFKAKLNRGKVLDARLPPTELARLVTENLTAAEII